MELSTQEQKELDYLQSKTRGHVPMSIEQMERQNFLIKKACHNNCLNPQCTGFEGIDSQEKCPKCDTKLYKNPDYETKLFS